MCSRHHQGFPRSALHWEPGIVHVFHPISGTFPPTGPKVLAHHMCCDSDQRASVTRRCCSANQGPKLISVLRGVRAFVHFSLVPWETDGYTADEECLGGTFFMHGCGNLHFALEKSHRTRRTRSRFLQKFIFSVSLSLSHTRLVPVFRLVRNHVEAAGSNNRP